jgi:hypothetical protein
MATLCNASDRYTLHMMIAVAMMTAYPGIAAESCIEAHRAAIQLGRTDLAGEANALLQATLRGPVHSVTALEAR